MKAKIMLQAVRPFSFTASVIPVLLGAAMAFHWHKGPVQWLYFPCALAAAILLHAGTNAASEYFDFKKGVDKRHTFGGSRVLVEGNAKPRDVLALGLALFAAGGLCAMFIVAGRGMPAAMLLLAALAGGFLYTGGPFGYKYLGLGDFFVFVLMGPLMVAGTFFALTGAFDPAAVHVSIPVGILVTAILSANNLRDIRHDREAGVHTLENAMGFSRARSLNASWIIAAYLSVVLMVCTGIVSSWAALVGLSAPLAWRNLKAISSAREGHPEGIAGLDEMNAKLHAVFGALLVIAVARGGYGTF